MAYVVPALTSAQLGQAQVLIPSTLRFLRMSESHKAAAMSEWEGKLHLETKVKGPWECHVSSEAQFPPMGVQTAGLLSCASVHSLGARTPFNCTHSA